MARMPRESAFMPTVKCSSCGKQIEISRMGEHLCGDAPPPVPEPAANSFFNKLNILNVWGSPAPEKQATATAPPKVDTAVASSYGSGQLGRLASPKTPSGRSEFGRSDHMASDSPWRQQPARRGPGGYGGFGESDEGDGPKKQAPPSLLQRMDTVTRGPFESVRKPSARNAFSPGAGASREEPKDDDDEWPDVPRAPQRTNGYGGFGPPRDEPSQVDMDMDRERDKERGLRSPLRDLRSPVRADTYPRQREGGYGGQAETPARTPSAPGPRLGNRRPGDGASVLASSIKDTSRPPPPRTSIVRPQTSSGRDSNVNLDKEFGARNPYHATSGSISSTGSSFSQSGQSSQPSSQSSPPKSVGRGWNLNLFRKASDTSTKDKDKELPPTPNPPFASRDVTRPLSPAGRRPARPDGYDPRIDPAVQKPRPGYSRSPLTSPSLDGPTPFAFSPRDDPAVQEGRRTESPGPMSYSSRSRSAAPPSSRSAAANHGRPRSRSRPREPTSRGTCKSCRMTITGKSISSADGRLTGRYHKACFVCKTCSAPFPTAEFYVLDDQPYCEQHYHVLNGSLCGSCRLGIEGQYLEDEAGQKFHVGCFRCNDCQVPLRDGYFEVKGKAYCEKDAWRLMQQPPGWSGGGSERGGDPRIGGARGLPGGPRGMGTGLPGSGGNRAPPRQRLEKRMTRLGMMRA